MAAGSSFKLTYATMFNPPEEIHTRFDEALAQVNANLGKEHAMIIDGKDVLANDKFEDRAPANTDIVLGVFEKGTAEDANKALAAARKAFPVWSHMKWQDRVALMRQAAEIMDRRIFEMAVVVSMEVGKNRMEALGDVAETADLIRYSCDRMEANDGFVAQMGKDPLVGFDAEGLDGLHGCLMAGIVKQEHLLLRNNAVVGDHKEIVRPVDKKPGRPGQEQGQ